MKSAAYTIRRAHPSDANDIAAAHRDSIRSVGPQFYPANVVEDWGEGLTPNLYVIAMEGGEVFFVAIGHILRIVDVRGMATRRGVGSALWRVVEAHAISKGATSIQVEASLAGVEFCRVNGFEEISRGETNLKSGRRIACAFMRKTLAKQ